MKRRLNPEYVSGILRRTKGKVGEELSPKEIQAYCNQVVEMLERTIAEKPYRGRQVIVELDVPGITPKKSLTWEADRLSDFYDELTEEETQNAKKARLLRMSIRARFVDIQKEAEEPVLFSNLSIKRAERIQKISQLILDELHELDKLQKLDLIDGLSAFNRADVGAFNKPIL